MEQHQQLLHGGKYIAEGTYGCTFAPSLPCHEKANKGLSASKDRLGKIFDSRRSFKEEKQLQRLIHKLDPTSEFTVEFFGSCDVDIHDAKPVDKVDNCEKISKEYSEALYNDVATKWPQLVFKYGGDDLTKVTTQMNTKYKSLYLDDIICMLLPVCKGLMKMTHMGYAHMDIKPPNILLDKNQLKLIDFGLVQKYKHVVKDNTTLKFVYMYYPPEFSILYLMQKGFRNQDTIYNDVLKNFKMYGADKTLEFTEFADYKNKLSDFVNVALATPLANFEHDFTSIFATKIDVYSLGMTLVDIMMEMVIYKVYRIRPGNEPLVNAYMYILMRMINPNPYERASSTEIYILFQRMLMDKKLMNNKHKKSGKHTAHVQDPHVIKYMNLKDLKNILVKANLPTKGTKAELYARILAVPTLA
jgi:serine/threonine protein kinase